MTVAISVLRRVVTVARARQCVPLLVVLGLACMSAPAYAGNRYEKVTSTFGSKGSGPGEFKEPTAIAVNDETDDVYVLDNGNDRIEYFTSAGTYLGQFNGSGEYEQTVGGVLKKEKGTAAPTGKFLNPTDIAIDNAAGPSYGDVYVADTGSGHEVVDRFSATGKYEGQLTGRCESIGEASPCTGSTLVPFSGLLNVAVDPTGNLWVQESAQFYEFSDTGSLEEEPPPAGEAGGAPPGGFAVDSKGDVYVTQGGAIGEEVRIDEFEKTTGTRTIITRHASSAAVLAIIAANNDLLVDEGPSIELFKSPLFEDMSPLFAFPSTGLSESAGIAVNGAEGEGTLYATQRTADNVDIFVAGAPEQPQIVSAKATSTTSETGQFEAVVKPGDRKTSVTVEYSRHVSTDGKELEGSIETLNGQEVAAEFGEGTSIITGAEFPSAIATYYYRVTATNTLGTVRSQVYAYTKLPIIAQENVYEKTSTTALLEATVEPDFIETTYAFEYAETEAALNNGEGIVIHGATGFLQSNKLDELKKREERLRKEEEEGLVAPGTVPICPGIAEEGGTGTLPESEAANLKCPVTADLAGLTPGQKYYYRVVAENRVSKDTENVNQGEPIRGPIEELMPDAAPAVTTGESASITSTTAALSGEVNPEGAPTTYEFAYISEAGYLQAQEAGAANPYAEGETTEPRQLSASKTIQAVGPVQAADLLPATTYRYALIATNQFGIQTIGEDHTFTTQPPTPPAAATPPPNATVGLLYLLTPPATPAGVPIPATALGHEPHSTITPPLTNKQKLAKALRTCRKDKKKSKRLLCEKTARKKYKLPSSKRTVKN